MSGRERWRGRRSLNCTHVQSFLQARRVRKHVLNFLRDFRRGIQTFPCAILVLVIPRLFRRLQVAVKPREEAPRRWRPPHLLRGHLAQRQSLDPTIHGSWRLPNVKYLLLSEEDEISKILRPRRESRATVDQAITDTQRSQVQLKTQIEWKPLKSYC